MKLRMSCQEASRRLSERLDGDLSPGDRTRLRLHLVMCDACRTVERQFGFLRAAMQRLGDVPTSPGHEVPDAASDPGAQEDDRAGR